MIEANYNLVMTRTSELCGNIRICGF